MGKKKERWWEVTLKTKEMISDCLDQEAHGGAMLSDCTVTALRTCWRKDTFGRCDLVHLNIRTSRWGFLANLLFHYLANIKICNNRHVITLFSEVLLK
jgi:hypothetical protein